MSETPLFGTIGFARKVQVKAYETADASFFVQFAITPDMDGAAIIDAARSAFTSAKGVVLEQLGLDMEIGSDGVLVETVLVGAEAIKASFPGAQEVPAVASGFDGLPESKPSHIKAEIWHALNTLGPKAFFDNRPKKSDGSYKSTAADFKAKQGFDYGSVWLTKKAS